MANRVGKYKLSKKDSALSLVDGGTASGRISTSGPAASVAFSGGSAAGTGTALKDNAGVITVSTQIASGNTATVTFSSAWDSAPACTVGGLLNYTYQTTTTTIVITGTGNTGTGAIYYTCMGV